MMVKRGTPVTYETVRELGFACAARLKKKRARFGAKVASARSLHQDEWDPALLVAGGGAERSGHRYPSAAAPGPLGSFAFPSQVITQYGGKSTARHHHGKATELCCSEETDFAGCGTSAEPLSEQSSREFASANSLARKADEALLISRGLPTFSLCV
jgi:hypothetical protein